MEKREKDAEKKEGKSFMSKASEIGKKMIGGIQNGVKNISEQSQKKKQEKRIKKYNPLFPEIFQSAEFHIPNVISIVDDAVRRDVDVCEGAIGWTEKVKDVEVLYLYDEFVEQSNIKFIPQAGCDAIYSMDPFEKGQFINIDTIFERTLNEKLAELEHIAYCLGAKSCSIEIMVFDNESLTVKTAAKVGAVSTDVDADTRTDNSKTSSAKNKTYFEGNEKVKMPKLKWFGYDENIKGLIDMRRSGKNLIKSKALELNCSTVKTMSHKTAIAIDKMKGGKLSATVKSTKEQNTKLLFEVEF